MTRKPHLTPAPEELAARILELDKVLALVAEQAATAPAKTQLLNLQPVPTESGTVARQLTAELKRTAAFKDLIAETGSVPLNGIEDLDPFLKDIWMCNSFDDFVDLKSSFAVSHGDSRPNAMPINISLFMQWIIHYPLDFI